MGIRSIATALLAAVWLAVPVTVPAGESAGSSQTVYPNPFKTGEKPKFQLSMPKSADIRIAIFDMLGGRIKELFRGLHPEGNYDIEWDGNDETGTPVVPGVYICVLFSEGVAVKSVKVIKLRA